MKILVYPFDINPYQKLLYSHIASDNSVFYLNKVFFPIPSKIRFFSNYPLLIIYWLFGFRLFHLHWPAFDFPFDVRFRKKISYYNTKFFLKLLKFLGFKIVWTIHNIVPHEDKTGRDLEIARFISKLSDVKVVHSEQNLKDVSGSGMDTKNVSIIPHGNYIGYYKNSITRSEARKKLGISEDEFVFLFNGKIRAYKGLEDALRVYNSAKLTRTKFIVAGKAEDKLIKKDIEEYIKNKNIIFKEGYVLDDDFQVYMNASDVCIFPFKDITASGSVILSLSFGKPIIYRNVGGLKDLPDNLGYSYNRDSELKIIMKKAIKNKYKLKSYEKNALKYAKSLSWDKIAKETIRIYNLK